MKRLCILIPIGQSARFHLGHYFSVIQPALNYGCDVLVATYHTEYPTEGVNLGWMDALNAIGISRSRIIFQEDVFNSERYFRLLTIAQSNDLNRIAQYKNAKDKTAHLFSYPVLMTHDAMGYDEVYVREEQMQHLGLAKGLIHDYNRKFNDEFVLPTGINVGGGIMHLRASKIKMSQTHPDGCIFLDDPEEDIREKVKNAVADTEGIANLYDINRRLGGFETYELNTDLKAELTERLIRLVKNPASFA